MLLISYSMSDIGKKRKNNEDFFYADDTLGLYIVADGVGGQDRGEVASLEAVENMQCWILRHKGMLEKYRENPTQNYIYNIRRMLESGVQSSCYLVFGLAQQLEPGSRMATTMSVALFVDNMLFVGQVGDSRIYRFRNGMVEQLTEDHTLLNYQLKHGLISPSQAANSKKKSNVITRAVGQLDYVEVDTFNFTVEPSDRYILCSDGLHGYFRNLDEIGEILKHDLPTVPGRFIELANSRGGKDNITVIALELL
ncbi:protein phosphatase 2C domain-containing protein [Myxococcota bacterium]|nr:protein phosphatase 2C domain-containing protein [Myxococcota bacterium]MBU1380159.1 protein phosphatase 2C domain-containing protein [Myxococcota bacterium]MBU1498679.1 protein phosphatase 2C domain-containing protein [Myxococcota bacterium]